MPSIGPLELMICLVPLLSSALFLFILLKVISGIRRSREVGDRASTVVSADEGKAPPAGKESP